MARGVCEGFNAVRKLGKAVHPLLSQVDLQLASASICRLLLTPLPLAPDSRLRPVFVLICAKDQYVIQFLPVIEVLESASY